MQFSSAALLRAASVGSTVFFARAFAGRTTPRAVPSLSAAVPSLSGARAAIGRRVFVAPSSSSSILAMAASGSSASAVEEEKSRSAATTAAATTSATGEGKDDPNPLLSDWSSEPYHLPPFRLIEPSHFRPAFDVAMERHMSDLKSIVESNDDDDDSPPTFESVIAAHDRAGSLLSKISSVFGNYCSSLNTDEMKAVQSEMSPVLSRHGSAAVTLPGLFERIDAVYRNRNDSGLDDEQIRLVERVHLDFTRQGADFTDERKEEYAEIEAELAALQTSFMQNVMTDEETWCMTLGEEDLVGCPDSLIEASKSAAEDRRKKKKTTTTGGEGEEDAAYVITLSRSLVEPFLTFSSRRDLRETAWEAWTKRGELHPERDNLAIAAKILKLRKRQANLHGCATFSEYQCKDTMAGTPERVMELLEDVWVRAKEAADREREALEKFVEEESGDELEGGIRPWDWRYYAERVRVARYSFDESALKPYLSLDAVSNAVMSVSNKLFGLTYVKRDDVEGYHPDVNVYEVTEKSEDGGSDKLRAVFLTDNYARPYKSSGAWMSEFRSQTRNLPDGADGMESIPVVVNNNNFAKAADSTLLSFDDAKTLFHECGHGHHGMLSDATYSRLSSTSVLRDFVELPSQLLERWFDADAPEVLKEHARHYETNEPVPDELLAKLKNARSFNQGFDTIEYTACALLDMAIHSLDDYGDDDFDISAFEERELERLGMPQGIVMRHRPAHFAHLFASQYYASCYYVYLWAEVLDADAFGAFEEAPGGIFDPEVASMARRYIYGAGNTEAPDELFRKFRGRDPDVRFMLEKKGLA
mmetsp:Transcript_43020/g.130976  ORF Transcript_43020/g.130976 Transcript_43020/m.130976 type:complete len:815 (-) Transcript_43020:154-2598(-)